MPDFLPLKGWQIGVKRGKAHYVQYCSRLRQSPIRRGERLHRVVLRTLLSLPALPEDLHVHHIDYNMFNCCPCNLLIMPKELHTQNHMYKDPYTGEALSRTSYFQRYEQPRTVPEWVAQDF